MKLKDLVQDKNTKLKVIITESQFKRLTDKLLDNKENKIQKDSKKKNDGSKK
jgi:hypothetical protein